MKIVSKIACLQICKSILENVEQLVRALKIIGILQHNIKVAVGLHRSCIGARVQGPMT